MGVLIHPDREGVTARSLRIGWVAGAVIIAIAAVVIVGSRASGDLTPALLASLAGLGLVFIGCYIGLESLRHSRTATTTTPRLDAYESFAAARQTAWLAAALVLLGAALLIAPLFANGDDSSPSPSPTLAATDS